MKLKILIYGLFFMIFAASCSKEITDTETLAPKTVGLKAGVVGDYYVAKTGSDNNAGTSAAPFLTIQKAANVAVAGKVIIVRDGVYSSTAQYMTTISRGGSAGNYITFKSENDGGAILDGGNVSEYGITIMYGQSYVRIEGFEIRNFLSHGLMCNGGSKVISNVVIHGCNFHDIGKTCDSQPYGRDAMYLKNTTGFIIENNKIHDIGRYAPGENGCSPSNAYYKNHDHGIYVDGGTNMNIRYNVFYKCNRGWALHFYPTASSGINIYNNTFDLANPYRDGSSIIFATSMTNVNVKNNIFNGQTNYAIEADAVSYSGVVISRNICHGGVGGMTDNSRSGITVSGNLTNTDPKLVNSAAYNFILQSTSPAIHAGVNVGLIADFMNNPIVGLPDIGAY